MSPTPSNRRDPRGFTLLEIMLAVVILGLLLGTIYGALSRTSLTKEIAEDRAELYTNGRQAVLRKASDIEGALQPQSGDRFFFKGVGGSSPELQMISVNRGGYGVNRVRPGRVLVAYTLDPLPQHRGGFALRRDEYLWSHLLAEADGIELPAPSDDEPTPPPAQSTYLLDCPNVPDDLNLPGACTAVTALRFRYYDDVVRDWREEWDSDQDPTYDRLPAAVEITLLIADENGAEHDFGTIVDLPLAFGQTPRPHYGQQNQGQGQGQGQNEDEASK